MFSPAILFAGGEAGAWYDPSDLTTLFQDTAGTTPVTSSGQTVGLMLDKSQGLTLGPELVTNGTFDTDISGWTSDNDATLTWVSNALRIDTNVSSAEAHQNITTVVGKTYTITVTSVGGTRAFYIRLGSVFTVVPINSSASYTFVATSTSTRIEFASGTSSTNVGYGLIDNISVKELPGNHATQPTAAARPTYQTDGTYHWLSFDGVDDFMVTPTITPGIDKVQVFAGVRKLSDSAVASLIETSEGFGDGRLAVFSPTSSLNNIGFASRGSLAVLAVSNLTSPATNVVSGLSDISGDLATLRIDGTQEAQSTGDQGTGNYLAYPMYIGMRAGTSLPFTGNIYSLVTRFGANLETSTIETTETYVAGKTGVTL